MMTIISLFSRARMENTTMSVLNNDSTSNMTSMTGCHLPDGVWSLFDAALFVLIALTAIFGNITVRARSIMVRGKLF